MDLEELVKKIESGKIEVQLPGVEFKSSWHQSHGKDISAIANNEHSAKGWVVIGVNDNGSVCGHNVQWLKNTELEVSNHIRQYLEPSWAVIKVFGKEIAGAQCLFIEISNPQDVVNWNGTAYSLIGTTSSAMKLHEVMALSLRLPGTDFSKSKYSGIYTPSLITEFAQKITQETDDLQIDVSSISPNEILNKLNIIETNTAGILFGNFPYRVVHFDENGDIFDQKSKHGLFNILLDSFIEEIQSRARKKGTALGSSTIAATEEEPYPLKALREILANAVAHTLYQKNFGDVVVETHPNRITVSNNCTLEAKAFVDKWFSRIHKPFNKHLMNTLRIPRITDEQGSGKIRVFRLMLGAGKREPIIDFEDLGDYGRWSITLFNEEKNIEIRKISDELRDHFANKDQVRIATALLLWRNYPWSRIEGFLDEHFKYVANEVLMNEHSPVFKHEDKVYAKRWAQIRLTGQTTKTFTEGEKTFYYELLYKISMDYRTGHVSSYEARRAIGLSDTPSERTQLARLFSEWEKKGLIKNIKKGHWQFFENMP